MIPIINTILWRMGGAGVKPLGPEWRRLGFPLCLLLQYFNHPLILVSCLIAALVVRLPITLISNSVHSHFINWIWVWILPGLYLFPSFIIVRDLPNFAISWFFIGLIFTLGNITATRHIFVHEFFEAFTGFLVIG